MTPHPVCGVIETSKEHKALLKARKGTEIMKRNEFVGECARRTIDPGVALENENILEALKKRDDKRVLWLLDNEF